MEFTLPDCTQVGVRLDLDPWEEERLLLSVARDGRQGLERFSAEYGERHTGDDFGERLRQYRERLDEQAARVLEDRRHNLDREAEEQVMERTRALEEFRGQRPHIMADTERVEIIDLEGLLVGDDLLALVRDRPPLTRWERFQSLLLRIRLALRRLLDGFLNLFLDRCLYPFLDRVRGGPSRRGGRRNIARKPRHAPHGRGRLSLTLMGGRMKYSIGVSVTDLLARPDFRKRVLSELRDRGAGAEGSLDPAALEDMTEELLRQHMEANLRKELRRNREEEEERAREHERKEKTLREGFHREGQKIERLHQRELDELRKRLGERMRDPVKDLVERHLMELGFIERDGERVIPTTALLERFADLIFHRELAALPDTGTRTGHSDLTLGIYEKARMRSVYEESRMDIVSSLVNARINHPRDRHIEAGDIIVHREESALSTHVVIMVDLSSSMEENRRLEAAKRTVMALYRAVKRKRERDRIDIIGFETRVSLMDLMAVWNAEPRGFTNIGGALRNARLLFEDSKADVKMAYLITDGLPEAYTDSEGREVAGEVAVCLDHALKEAGMLNAHLTMILLEPGEERYIEAGKAIVRQAGGKLVITNPDELIHEVLSDYLHPGAGGLPPLS